MKNQEKDKTGQWHHLWSAELILAINEHGNRKHQTSLQIKTKATLNCSKTTFSSLMPLIYNLMTEIRRNQIFLTLVTKVATIKGGKQPRHDLLFTWLRKVIRERKKGEKERKRKKKKN